MITGSTIRITMRNYVTNIAWFLDKNVFLVSVWTNRVYTELLQAQNLLFILDIEFSKINQFQVMYIIFLVFPGAT